MLASSKSVWRTRPRSGDKPEWQHSQDYLYESKAIPAIDLDDPIFSYSY